MWVSMTKLLLFVLLSWLGKTLCPPNCLVKSEIRAPSCTAIFRLGIVVLQCVRAGKVFCGLHVAHVRIICPVRDVTHVRKCTSPLYRTASDGRLGEDLGTRLAIHGSRFHGGIRQVYPTVFKD